MAGRQGISFNDSSNQSSFLFAHSPSVRQSTSRYIGRGSTLSFNSTLEPLNESSTFFAPDSTINVTGVSLSNTLLDTSAFDSRADTTILPQESTFVSAPHHFIPSSPSSESWTTLCHQFLDALEKHTDPGEVFDLAKESEDICSDHLNILEQLKKQRAANTSSVPSDILSMLRFERNSWRLARSLYLDRATNSTHQTPLPDQSKVLSDNDVVDQLYARKSLIREMQLVVDWCEQNYLEDIRKIEAEDKIEFYSEGPHYWEHTLHVASTKSKVPGLRSADLCLQMDPDAYHRTGKEINQQDKEDEVRVMRFIFRNLRAGKLDLGRETAQKLGYHWLAASLQGWMLHHDFRIENPNSEFDCEGNACRDLWKYGCWESSTTPTMSLMEKAIFGLLSGNLSAVLPACSTWEDEIWAYFRCSIDTQIEEELRNTSIPKPVTCRTAGQLANSSRFSVDMPNDYWANMKTSEEVLQEISCHLNDYNWNREEKFHFFVQVYIILDDIDNLLSTIHEYINEKDDTDFMSNKLRPQLLRFAAHLVLFLRNADRICTNTQKQYYTSILEAYINYLIEKKFISLVAPYVAQLPPEPQVYSYSRLLKDVTDKSERVKCLQLARDHNLNVEEITQKVVETMKDSTSSDSVDSNLRSRVDISIEGINSAPLTEADQKLIRSLEWLSVGNIQYIELLKQSNSLIRTFILNGKLLAAKEVFAFTPRELICAVQTAWKKKTGTVELSPELKNQTKQHLCWDFLFRALESFRDWLNLYKGQPVRPSWQASRKFSDRIAQENSERQYEADIEQWQATVSQHAIIVAGKINEVLTFPDSGWLKDSEVTNISRKESDISQAQELATIRRRFIPQLTFLLHSILHLSACYSAAIRLSEVVASDLHKLHEEFTQEQLKSLMKKIRESSIAAMNENLDSLGSELTYDDGDEEEN